MIETALRARIDSWLRELAVSDDSAALDLPFDPVRLAFVIATGGAALAADETDALAGDRVALAVPARELAARLDDFAARAREARDERDDHVLWLACGELDDAPLWLLPVELVGERGAYRLVAVRDRAPRLGAGARDLEVESSLDVAGVLAVAERAPDRRFARAVRLVVRSFAADDLARDLEACAVARPIAAPLAWIATECPPPALPPFGAAPPVAAFDADAGQRAAIAAAASGASFVLAGAPGTGASHAIASAVVACVAAGRSVLVASERPATLAALHARLASVGLGELALALDAGDGNRARVAAALARALDRAFRPAPGAPADARLAELAAQLDAHAAAMHRPGALGLSVFEAIARLVELADTPRAALAERDAPSLDRICYERRRRAVAELGAAADAAAPIATHPWHASALAACDDGRATRVARALDDATRTGDELAAAIADIRAVVPNLVARTAAQLRALGTLAQIAAASPRPGAELFAPARARDDLDEAIALVRARGGGALDPPHDVTALVALARRHRALVAELDDRLGGADGRASLAAIDLDERWRQLARWTGRAAPLRYLGLRATRADVRAAAGDPARLADDASIRAAVEAAIAERACRDALVASAEPARRWLGAGAPRGVAAADAVLALDVDAIDAALEWAAQLRRAFDAVDVIGGDAERQLAWRALVAQLSSSPDGDAPRVLGGSPELAAFARFADAVARWEPAFDELAAAAAIDARALADETDHLASARARTAALASAADALPAWARFVAARRAAIDAGVIVAVAVVERDALRGDAVARVWERATIEAWLASALAESPALARFDGAAHHARVARFGDLDRGEAARARTAALAAIAARVPALPASDEEAAERALVRSAARVDARGDLRAQLAALPVLLHRLAPCIVATPHAIARHLDPAMPAFDVVIIEDAAALPAARAAGVLARGRAVIVVGDPRLAAEGSVLAAARAARLPELALARSHRARHDDAFAIAQRCGYAGTAALLPSALPPGDERGTRWRVASEDGLADAVIAELVAQATLAPARSIAVIAATRALARCIAERLDSARASDSPDAVALAALAAPPAIGTIERFRGDERDVAIIAIDEDALALAPAWLAVATTRAREQLAIVSSIDPVADGSHGELAAVLAHARFGVAARAAADTPANAIAGELSRALGERGWIVHHRVGCGGPAVELAVVDPQNPGRYVLAIELDDAGYASATAARDRDRLRRDALARLGWRTHVVWTLDWWRERDRELQRAHGAVVAAIAANRQRAVAQADRTTPTPAPSASRPTRRPTPVPAVIARPSTGLASGSGPAVVPTGVRAAITIGRYAVATVPAGRRAPDDLFAPRYAGELAKLVERVLAAEAPIHLDVLARRVGAYFGIGRVTDRVAAHVRVAVAGRGRWGDERDVVWRLDQDPSEVPMVRVAAADARRDIDEVPLAELAGAARIVVERAGTMRDADLVRDTARLVGFARLTDRVAARIAAGIELAITRGLVASDAETVAVAR